MNTDYFGLPTRTLDNGHLRLDFLTEAGPRIVRLIPAGSNQNILAEAPGEQIPTTYGPFNMYGGHRLWHAPEANPRTYMPDDTQLQIQDLPDGVRITGAAEAPTGIRKSIEIHLAPDRAAVTLDHELRNEGLWAVELAPWAITQVALGGAAILPQYTSPADANGLLPNRTLTLWPYTRWGDPRLGLNDDFVLVLGDSIRPPCKVGYFNASGWIGYLNRGVFFTKRFTPRPGQPHPDFNCNTEVYVNHLFLEIETLAPLIRLQPGLAIRHTETWNVYAGMPQTATVEGIRELVKTLGL
jgi:hypothetical protein